MILAVYQLIINVLYKKGFRGIDFMQQCAMSKSVLFHSDNPITCSIIYVLI